MYGHRSEWVHLEEDGFTGVRLCQRLIKIKSMFTLIK